jgi:hypothetical protein
MAGQLTIDTLRASSGVLATQNGMTGIAKAWVNFVGSSATITSSFNVSSVTRNGTGDYSVSFTTAMPNANYSIVATGNQNLSAYGKFVNAPYSTSPTTSSFRMATCNYNVTLLDFDLINVAIFSS